MGAPFKLKASRLALGLEGLQKSKKSNDQIEQIISQIPEQITRHIADQITYQITEQITYQVIEQIIDHITEQSTKQTMGQILPRMLAFDRQSFLESLIFQGTPHQNLLFCKEILSRLLDF